MVAKDFFSSIPSDYRHFRPDYSDELAAAISKLVPYRGVAWDCATGNGQLAKWLANHFNLVCGTDISLTQIQHARGHKGILYEVAAAEKTSFPDHFFDLVTVAQAIHWINIEEFYKEVFRVVKPGGIVAFIGYNLCEVDQWVDELLHRFYFKVLKDCWPPERRHVENAYADIPFPFEEIKMPPFVMEKQWTVQKFLGYLSTWSAVRNYRNKVGFTPMETLELEMHTLWEPHEVRTVKFPIILKVGRIPE